MDRILKDKEQNEIFSKMIALAFKNGLKFDGYLKHEIKHTVLIVITSASTLEPGQFLDMKTEILSVNDLVFDPHFMDKLCGHVELCESLKPPARKMCPLIGMREQRKADMCAGNSCIFSNEKDKSHKCESSFFYMSRLVRFPTAEKRLAYIDEYILSKTWIKW